MISYNPIKIEEQTTTKIDFHSSLNSQGNFSVNEAAKFIYFKSANNSKWWLYQAVKKKIYKSNLYIEANDQM